MRFMIIVKATPQSEAGDMPKQELLEAMGKFNEELVAAGIMLAGEGLQPSSRVPHASTSRAISVPSWTVPSPRPKNSSPVSGYGSASPSKKPSNGSSGAPIPTMKRASSRFVRSSNSTTSAQSSPRASG